MGAVTCAIRSKLPSALTPLSGRGKRGAKAPWKGTGRRRVGRLVAFVAAWSFLAGRNPAAPRYPILFHVSPLFARDDPPREGRELDYLRIKIGRIGPDSTGGIGRIG